MTEQEQKNPEKPLRSSPKYRCDRNAYCNARHCWVFISRICKRNPNSFSSRSVPSTVRKDTIISRIVLTLLRGMEESVALELPMLSTVPKTDRKSSSEDVVIAP